MKLPITKATALSTGHISKNDSCILRAVAGREILSELPRVERHYYGWFVFVTPDKDTHDGYRKAIKAHGFSPAFQRLYRLAFQQKIHILDFDQDGEEVKGLEVFDW